MEKLSFYAYGHSNIQATHRSTLEITKEKNLSLKGNCIIAVRSQYACSDLPRNISRLMKNSRSKIILILEVDDLREIIKGYGDEKLILTSPTSMVIRKSTFIDERTLMIKADKSASDIDRSLVDKLRNPNKRIKITLELIEDQ